MQKKPKKVLLLGSGALKIGEAGEFDYSGSQALKALREESIQTVLVNPNIATIQTSQELADKVYFLPVTPYFVEKVIAKERPDGILLNFGGQTALNCGLALGKMGVFKKYKVEVLGTQLKTIELTEDRRLFAEELASIGVFTPHGEFATTLEEAQAIVDKIGFPVMVRAGFTLGGLGSSVVHKQSEFTKVVTQALRNAPQITVEEYLQHWKELEYEVVRDAAGNKIVVCNMENLDPLGIHTGESIVVAPSQTLNNLQYHFLRTLALDVIEHLGVVGECNIQFALDPKSNEYRVIEVNARLSRSSALASKATGYPLAYIAAKLSLGYKLYELKNNVTQSTSAMFEPALDYIVIKIPRWDLQKFVGAQDKIGTEMKSVGEVMAIGRSFPEVLQKALRMLETGKDGLLNGGLTNKQSADEQALKEYLTPSTKRLFSVAEELAHGTTVEKIYKASGIDPWFLWQLKAIVDFELQMAKKDFEITKDTLRQAKQLGFSDKLIAQKTGKTEKEIRDLRKQLGVLPVVKQIDTLAAEYPAKTNYMYVTYNASDSESALATPEKLSKNDSKHIDKAIVIGCGPYRIGSSVEFDWCCVTAVQTLRKQGVETIIINSNPETVSTDFDSADKLYFDELTFERVADIYDLEQTAQLVLAFGGQIANNLALPAYKAGLKILGTSPVSIDNAEDRHKFSALLDELEINQPFWQQLKSAKEAVVFAQKIGYPVLIRPSYVLSGSAMNVAHSPKELTSYLEKATDVSKEHPVVISKFIDNAKEIEIDGVAKNGELLIYAISEHIENAGVHSGDATLVLPPQRLYLETMRKIKLATKKIIGELKINGPFNIQYMAKDNNILVIELNLRASRSFPFVSKTTGYNFIEAATRVMLGEDIFGDYNTIDLEYVGVKAPQFSFNRIKGADPKLRVEMSSTGEVACFGDDLQEAYLKAILATGFKIPQRGVFLSIGGEKNKVDFLKSAIRLQALGLKIYATENTSAFLSSEGVKNTRVYKLLDNESPTIIELLQQQKIDLAINISVADVTKKAETDGFVIRRNCVDYGVPLFTNLQAANTVCAALAKKAVDDLEIKSWDEYVVQKAI